MLYDHQLQVKREIYQAMRDGHTHIGVQAMTSFGKTVLAADIIHDALSKGVGVLFTAPFLTLVDQTIVEFNSFGIKDIGVIQADHFLTDYSQPVQVCSIQTIETRMKADPAGWKAYQQERLIIHDEFHICHKTHEAMNRMAVKPVIGLSATPWRKGLGKQYSHLVNGPSTRWLIDNGFLSDYRAYSHHVPDMSGVKTVGDDFSKSEAGEKYTPRVIGDIVKHWFKLAAGRKTILFAPRVADAERFAAEFRAAGVKSVSVNGYMDQVECQEEIEKFRQGQIDVLCSVAKLATGFSVKDVGCIIDAQPTKSLMRHIQKLGRGLRTHPDKDDVIILDNAGNMLRNGLPDDQYPDHLDDGKNRSKIDRKPEDEPLPKACPSCGFMKPPKTKTCPSCGFEAARQSQLEVEEGELVELRKKKKLNKDATPEQKEQFFGELKHYAYMHNYREGWASNKYKEKFGVWPNKYRNAPRVPASEETLNWIKSRQIAFAKRKVS